MEPDTEIPMPSKLKSRKSQSKFNFDDLKDYLIRTNIIERNAGIKGCWCFSQRTIRICRVIRIRLLMILSICSTAFFLVCSLDNFLGLLCLLAALVILAETIYICLKHDATDFYWFSISSSAYTVMCISIFWIFARRKYELDDVSCVNSTLTGGQMVTKCYSFLDINTCQLIYLILVTYLLLLILSRWLMPASKRQSRKSHAYLLAMLIASTADFFDLIEYGNIPEITDVIGIDLIYAVGCISLIQFSFNLTATKEMTLVPKNKRCYYVEFLLGTEAWSILLVYFTQELPSLYLRLYILIKCGVFVHPTLYFFIMKNALLILVEFFRVFILYGEFKEIRGYTFEMTQRPSSNKVTPLEAENVTHSGLTKKGKDFLEFCKHYKS